MSDETDRLRQDPQALLDELNAARPGCVRNAKRICCPFHDDRHPGNSIHQGSDGVWRYKCFNGSCDAKGDIFDIRARRTGRSVEDVLKETSGTYDNSFKPKSVPKMSKVEKPRWFATEAEIEEAHSHLKLEDKFPYRDYKTLEIICLVYRFRKPDGKKHIPPYTPVDGGWLEKGIDGIRPIFNCQRVMESQEVIIVEGENKVKTLTKYGFTATCNMGGSNAADAADWSILSGKHRVTIWRDNDDAGAKWQATMIGILKQLPAPPTEIRLVWVDGLNLKEKGDVADLVKEMEADRTDPETIKATLTGIIRDARGEVGGAEALRILFSEIIAGRHDSIPWSHTYLSRATCAFVPGTVTILYGKPGSSKSLFLLQECIYWTLMDFKVSILELEQNRLYHERRMFAIWKRNSMLTNNDYIKTHPELVDLHVTGEDEIVMNQLYNRLHESPKGADTTIADVIQWVENRFKAGDRIVCVDPISACASGNKPWIEDKNLINVVKAIADKYRGNVILISHTDKMGENLMGGASLVRFSHCVLKLIAYPHDNYMTVTDTEGRQSQLVINRGLYIEKARDSWGAMYEDGFTFNANELRFHEHGPVKKKRRSESAKLTEEV